MEILQTSDQKILTLNMLVYGDPGVGKTSFIGTAKNVLIADTESGLLALKDQDVPYVAIRKWADIEELYRYLRDEKHDFKVIAIDTMTELTKKLVQEMEEGKKFTNASGGLTLQGWGEVIKKVRNTVRAFRDLNISVIFTAHAQFESTDEASKMRVPMLQGKLPMELASMVDIVGYMEVVGDGEDKKHVIRAESSQKYYAKDRTETSDGIMKPDFEEIRQAVFENKKFAWTKKVEKVQDEKNADFEKGLEQPSEVVPIEPIPQTPKTPPIEESAAKKTMREAKEKRLAEKKAEAAKEVARTVQCDAEIGENERCEEMLSDAEVKFCNTTASKKMLCFIHQIK